MACSGLGQHGFRALLFAVLVVWNTTAFTGCGRWREGRIAPTTRWGNAGVADDHAASTSDDAKRELLFQEVLSSKLQTLAVATNCSRALIYLQSEKEKVLQVVCRYPTDQQLETACLPEETEYVPMDCILPMDYHDSECSPKSTCGTVFDFPIVYREASVALGNWFSEPDYYGLLRVEYPQFAKGSGGLVVGEEDERLASALAEPDFFKEDLNSAVKRIESVGKSIAQSLALSIKLEYMHFEHGCKIEEDEDETDEDRYTKALLNGIWTTASNSIKTMRTMLKMLERRNDEDEIGKETYENIHVQLETLGVSISPLMPSIYRSVETVMDDYDRLVKNEERDNWGVIGGEEEEPQVPTTSPVWESDKEESQIEYGDDI